MDNSIRFEFQAFQTETDNKVIRIFIVLTQELPIYMVIWMRKYI